MADQSVTSFYDALAASYHLIFADWRRSLDWHGDMLDQLIRQHIAGQQPLAVLDCSCGIGTQALGLALRGYRVHGTDLSIAAIHRARQEASNLGVETTFAVADMRALNEQVEGSFDVVISCDNALPHLLTDADLELAARGMAARLRPGGLLLANIRDYDALLDQRPVFNSERVLEGPEGRRIVFQIWDWDDKAISNEYTINLFIVQQKEDGWETRHFATRYRALRREELNVCLGAAGFESIQWHMDAYFSPVVTAFKPAD